MSEKQRTFQHEFKVAKIVLDGLGRLEWSNKADEVFRFISNDVNLIFYPYTAKGSRSESIRVRDSNSKDWILALQLMAKLYIGSGHNNMFICKQISKEAMSRFAKDSRLVYGWAEDEARKS